MNKNILKKYNGITLIVLVVSIIVLLILAGAAISMFSGNNGILNKAVNAKINTEEAAEKEKIQLVLTAANKKSRITDESLAKACELEFGIDKTKSKVFDDGDITILVTDSGREYYIDKNNNITMTKSDNVIDEEGLSGGGTSADPYKINSIEDLILLAKNVNNGTNYSGKYVELTRNLDFRSISSYRKYDEIVDEENNIDIMTSLITGEGFTPIGNSSKQFSGKFDGKEHKIKNLYENREGFVALFYKNGSPINNLTLNNVYLKSSAGAAGGLCMGSCNVTNCHIDGTIISDTGNASGYQGATGGVTNCSVDCIIKGKSYVGGLFASGNSSKITKCNIKGNIEGQYAGGFIGQDSNSCTIDGCINYADITGKQTSSGFVARYLWCKGSLNNKL